MYKASFLFFCLEIWTFTVHDFVEWVGIKTRNPKKSIGVKFEQLGQPFKAVGDLSEFVTHLVFFLGIQIVIGVEERGEDAGQGCEKGEGRVGWMVGLHKCSSESGHANTLLFFWY